MSRELLIQPKTIPSQAFINLESYTGVEINRKMVEQDVKVESATGPGGRNKPKQIKIGTQLVPCPTGQIIVSVSTIKRDYNFIYRNEFSRQAMTLFSQIVAIIRSGQSGVATDTNDATSQPPVPPARQQDSDEFSNEEDSNEENLDEEYSEYDDDQDTHEEEYEDDPEYTECVFQCEKCKHIYAYEISDINMKIACEECGHENRMSCTKEDYDEAIRKEEEKEKRRQKPPITTKTDKKKPMAKKIKLNNSDEDDEDLKNIL